MRVTPSIGATWLFVLLALPGIACAKIDFPKLTGRVVDQAGMLSSSTEKQISALSEAHEKATGNQVVVVTVNSLDGNAIEEYGYQLGRYWGIGQKGKNNGVLLIVAKAERKIRIEVGYGLEGELTDAISSNIISTVITPQFKSAQFDEGVLEGTQAIIQALGGQYEMRERKSRSSHKVTPGWLFLVFIVVFWILPGIFGRRSFWGGLLLGSMLGRSSRHRGGWGGGGGGFGGGGFGGGGGSFGGGGASGGW
ncbi:MAG: TPM domain-containing protein [Pseudomonadales bacterium]|nr:TPM domain-containing protein [Pseudomonadales bacterium]